MGKPFLLNSSLQIPDIHDAITERFNKIKGVLNCLIFSLEFTQEDQELDNSSAYYALWSIDGFIDEIISLRELLSKA